MRLLSYPFRLTQAGDVATVEDGTEDAAAEELAVLILTRKGERSLVPDYGVTDPTFQALNLAEVAVGVLDYGPPNIVLDDVTVTYPTDTLERVELTIRLPEE
jgi:hypothetical protein